MNFCQVWWLIPVILATSLRKPRSGGSQFKTSPGHRERERQRGREGGRVFLQAWNAKIQGLKQKVETFSMKSAVKPLA
jgi:hypothetical protein